MTLEFGMTNFFEQLGRRNSGDEKKRKRDISY